MATPTTPAPDPSGQWLETDVGGGQYYDPVTFRVGHKGPDGAITPDPPAQDGTYYLWNPNAYPKAKRHGGLTSMNPDGTVKFGIDPRPADQKKTQTDIGAQTSTTTAGTTNYATNERNIAGERAAAEAANADEVRKRELALADIYNTTITDPNAPSVARAQLDQATQANEATQLAAASGASGENAFLARQGAARNIAALNQTEAQNKALLRAGEVERAETNLGGILNQTGGQDISRYATDTGAEGGLTHELVSTSVHKDDAAAAKDAADRDYWTNLAFRAAGGVGGALAAGPTGAAVGEKVGDKASDWVDTSSSEVSDRRLKYDIEPEPMEREMAFLSALTPDSFRYKGDPEAKEHHGVMAQDLEQSDIGRSLVHDGPKGKMVDVGSAAMAALAAAAHLHRRLEKLEGKGGKRG